MALGCLFAGWQHSDLYDKLYTDTNKPGREVFMLAMQGRDSLHRAGKLPRPNILTIIDLSMSSAKKRLWVIDLDRRKVLENSLVAHGRNSGELLARSFSNKAGSMQSSLGFYVTGEIYQGKHGYSLKLDGMEPGINDNARDRAIVIHGAHYVSRQFIERYGRLGRSFGCPALPLAKNKRIIDLIKDGSCLFIYYPSNVYREKSTLIWAG